jgi:DNA polymerase-3 subunit delta
MTAIRASEGDAFVKNPPPGVRLFLVYGDDAGGVTERARALEAVAVKRGGGEVLRIGSDELSADPGKLSDEAYAASLFGGEPVISLRVLDGRHNVAGAIEPLCERPPEAAWVIVEAGELSKTSPLRRAFEANKAGVAIPTFHPEGKDLAAAIRGQAKAAGVTIEAGAAELLEAALSGDRLASRMELEKLFLYVGERGAVTAEDVVAIVGETAESAADAIIDAALLGESEALERELERLRAESGSAAGLGALALRHLLHLQSLAAAVESGVPAEAALDRARPPVFGRRRSAIAAELRLWPAADLAEARRRINDAIYASRLRPALENAAISDALHRLARRARQLKRPR